MSPMEVLQPNALGSQFSNVGVENIAANLGWGVTDTMQANPAAASDMKQDANPAMTDLRRAKSREFGRPMEQLGF